MAQFADPPGEAKLCKGCSNRGLGGVTRRIRKGTQRMGWGSPNRINFLCFNFQSTEHGAQSTEHGARLARISTEHRARYEP